MSILIMSDLVPSAQGLNPYIEGRIEVLLSAQLRSMMEAAQWNIVNLECPLTQEQDPIRKWGSSLKASPESIALLRRIPHLVVNLANNHIRDYGDRGVMDTIHLLDHYGIPYLGAGPNASSSRKTLLLPLAGDSLSSASYMDTGNLSMADKSPDHFSAKQNAAAKEYEGEALQEDLTADRILSPTSPSHLHETAAGCGMLGIFTAAEHEFSAAGPDTAGAASLEEDDLLTIRELARQADYVIALYHGGEEFYPYPTPGERRRLQAWARAGADLIVCQHNHCISCAEKVGSSTIVYGQGNFLFGERPEVESNISDRHAWEHGMLVEVRPERDGIIDLYAEAVRGRRGGGKDAEDAPCPPPGSKVRYYYYRRECGMLVPDEDDAERHSFDERSRRLAEDGFTEKHWRSYCEKHREYAAIFRKDFGAPTLSVTSRLKRAAAEAAGVNALPQEEYLRIYDYLSCESHLEILQTLCMMEMEKTENICGD